MREKRSGTIVNIGSIFGWQGNAACPAYNVSNAALRSHYCLVHVPLEHNRLTCHSGFTDSLQVELGSFNIRSIIFEPGHFRTKITSPENTRANLSEHKDYQPMIAELNAALQVTRDSSPGDPKLGVERMVDVIRGEGAAEGRPMPAQLPLGSDALNIIKGKCLEIVKVCDEWEQFIKSTDYETGTRMDDTAAVASTN